MSDSLHEIRRAQPHEAGAISTLAAATFTETFGHLYKAKDLAAFLQSKHIISVYEGLIADPTHAVWIAADASGPLVGYAVAGPCDLPAPDLPKGAGELMRLYVLGAAKGGGVGTRLLEAALAWLDANFQHQYLSVYAENAGAQALYRRYGFEKVFEYEYMVGDHADPEWIMRRRR